jgi:hypothetical protein
LAFGSALKTSREAYLHCKQGIPPNPSSGISDNQSLGHDSDFFIL